MATEIINALRAKSTVVITGNTSTLITLDQLSVNENEVVSGVDIAQVTSTTNGIWSIYRGNDASGFLTMQIVGNLNLVMYEFDVTLSNNATSNIYVTNSGTAGTLIMQLSKSATYTTPLTGL
jgi:hypothetical protein